MLVVIAAVYAVFTLPYHVTWLFSVFGYPNPVAKKLCVLLVIATSAAHPIIYGALNQDFGKGFKSFFRFMRQRKNSNEEFKGSSLDLTRWNGTNDCSDLNDRGQTKKVDGIYTKIITQKSEHAHCAQNGRGQRAKNVNGISSDVITKKSEHAHCVQNGRGQRAKNVYGISSDVITKKSEHAHCAQNGKGQRAKNVNGISSDVIMKKSEHANCAQNGRGQRQNVYGISSYVITEKSEHAHCATLNFQACQFQKENDITACEIVTCL